MLFFSEITKRTDLPEVKSRPLTPPKVESDTNTGMIQAMKLYTLSPNVCSRKDIHKWERGWDNKYLSCVYGVDRKICHKGHRSASRGLPRDAEQ